MSRGPWFTTYSGQPFFLLDPRPEEIHIGDIVHALGHICRYGGHSRFHFAVLRHSVNVALMVQKLGGSRTEIAWGLLHDAGESYVGDMVSPLKDVRELAFFSDVEDGIVQAIMTRFGLPQKQPDIVYEVDKRMAVTEAPIVLGDGAKLWRSPLKPFEFADWPKGMHISAEGPLALRLLRTFSREHWRQMRAHRSGWGILRLALTPPPSAKKMFMKLFKELGLK